MYVKYNLYSLGKLTLMTGDIYEGDFLNGKRHGNGTMYFKEPLEGIIYKGEWYIIYYIYIHVLG